MQAHSCCGVISRVGLCCWPRTVLVLCSPLNKCADACADICLLLGLIVASNLYGDR
jgi:hypothetical protein